MNLVHRLFTENASKLSDFLIMITQLVFVLIYQKRLILLTTRYWLIN
jgi:hypothetical protein